MICDDLRDWIDLLGREGELDEVTAEVDPQLEITEIADRVVKEGGPALLFRNVRGSSLPLLINQFGTRAPHVPGVRRGATRRGRREGRLGARAASRRRASATSSRALGKLKSLADSRAKIVSSAPCQEVVRAGDARPRPAADPDLLARATAAPTSRCPRLHEGSGDRRAQRRHVPPAAVRRDALTACTGRSTRTPPTTGATAPRALEVAIAIGSDPIIAYAASCPAAQGRRRDDGRGLPARQAGRDGAVQDRRPAGAGATPRSCSRATASAASCARGAVRRPHRLLHARRPVPRAAPDAA